MATHTLALNLHPALVQVYTQFPQYSPQALREQLIVLDERVDVTQLIHALSYRPDAQFNLQYHTQSLKLDYGASFSQAVHVLGQFIHTQLLHHQCYAPEYLPQYTAHWRGVFLLLEFRYVAQSHTQHLYLSTPCVTPTLPPSPSVYVPTASQTAFGRYASRC